MRPIVYVATVGLFNRSSTPPRNKCINHCYNKKTINLYKRFDQNQWRIFLGTSLYFTQRLSLVDRRNINAYLQVPSFDQLPINCLEFVSWIQFDYHSNVRGHPFMTSTRRGSGSGGRMWTGGRGSSPMWTSTQKIKISPLTSYCLLLMQTSWRLFYQNFVFGQKKWKFFCDINQ